MMRNENEPVVYIVDDDPAVRDSLRLLVRPLGLCIEVFESAEAFLDSFVADRAGCLVLDVRMEGMTGLELQEKLEAKDLGIPIIFITGHGDVPLAVRAMQRGALDFLEKPFSSEVLLERIKDAVGRDADTREAKREYAQIAAKRASLTPREREVMGLVVSGKTNREIAEHLCRSEKTIKAHRVHIMKKLQAHTAGDMVRMAMTTQPA